tara:strand:+ start:381 stop:977 length:597 start_codon:yes stop_codon:yes gene_type:complete
MISNYNYWYFVNALPPGVCDEIVKIGLSKQKTKARIDTLQNKSNKVLSKVRDSDVVWLEDMWLRNLIGTFVSSANINAGWDFVYDTPEIAQFTIYDKNQHYNWHQDLSFDKDQTGQPSNSQRKLSVSIQLTDEKEYKGGELLFSTLNGQSKKKILTNELFRKKGTVVVFPSYMHHKVTPVTQGVRYSLVMWFRGPAFQ